MRAWQKKADRDHAHERAQCAHENCSAHWHADGTSGELAAQFGPIDGLEVAEILARYEDAEWRTDWEWGVETYGDDANTALLPRTAAQRRADAVTAALRDAASKRGPTTKTESDHMLEFSKGGRTDPDNGNPACKRHNLARHNGGFTVVRDRLGNWHTYRPDGSDVG